MHTARIVCISLLHLNSPSLPLLLLLLLSAFEWRLFDEGSKDSISRHFIFY
jgi:hypothetical protein